MPDYEATVKYRIVGAHDGDHALKIAERQTRRSGEYGDRDQPQVSDVRIEGVSIVRGV